jgi:hypothetical protein
MILGSAELASASIFGNESATKIADSCFTFFAI